MVVEQVQGPEFGSPKYLDLVVHACKSSAGEGVERGGSLVFADHQCRIKNGEF